MPGDKNVDDTEWGQSKRATASKGGDRGNSNLAFEEFLVCVVLTQIGETPCCSPGKMQEGPVRCRTPLR
jgi:hypothetical protein